MRLILLLAFLPLAGLSMAAAPEGPQPVTVAVPPGAAHDPALRIFLKPYADATGTALGTPAFDGSLDAVTALAAGGKLDLALVDGPVLAAGCKAGLFARLDWSGLGRDRFWPPAATDCGAGAFIGATVLAWDQAKLHATPSWGDFWDVAKFPGRRGLEKSARRTLEIALLADGVAPGDLYRVLRSGDGVDRAFRKLDQLKPYVEWWDKPGEPGQFLASGKVLMTAAPAAGLAAASKLHPGVQWAGCLDEVTSWAIPHAATHGSGSMAVIAIASDSARQADFAKATGLGPGTRTGFALLPADASAVNPASQSHLAGCATIDEGFWLDNGAKLEARFLAWLSK